MRTRITAEAPIVDIPHEAQWIELIETLDSTRLTACAPYQQTSEKTALLAAETALIKKHFLNLAVHFPTDSHQAHDWGTLEEQEQFLSDLLTLTDLKDKSILDLGCGDGSVLQWLEKHDRNPRDYLGLDVNEKALANARQRFPRAQWDLADCLADLPDIKNSPDYIVASGLFGVRPRTRDAESFSRLAIDRVVYWCSLAKEGVLFNFIPAFDPMVRELLDLKADTDNICYHRMERLWLKKSLEGLGLTVETQPASLVRLLVQCPFLIRGKPT